MFNSLSYSSDMGQIGDIGNNCSQTVLDTLQLVEIKRRETPELGIAQAKSTTNQSISIHKNSISYEIHMSHTKSLI